MVAHASLPCGVIHVRDTYGFEYAAAVQTTAGELGATVLSTANFHEGNPKVRRCRLTSC